LVSFLTRPEVDALLAAPDRHTWSGRRDHAFILTAAQTGFRLSEMTGLKREDLVLGVGAHLRVIGKGRRERCTPLAKATRAVLKAWLREPQRGDGNSCFLTLAAADSAFTAFSTCSTNIVGPPPTPVLHSSKNASRSTV
jgi:integrase